MKSPHSLFLKSSLLALSGLFATAFFFSACGSIQPVKTETPQTPAAEPAPQTKTEEPETVASPESPDEDEDAPDEQQAPQAQGEGCFGVLLPAKGRSRRLGAQLLETMRLHPFNEQGRLRLLDASAAADVEDALEQLQHEGCFGAAGLFDNDVAEAAAEAAAEASFPLIMLTVSDAPLKKEGPVYRALHTPSLVVRSLAGAALGRPGKKAVIARGEDAYGRNMAHLFISVWQASGGSVIAETTWEKLDSKLGETIAQGIKKAQPDVLFMPAGISDSALLLSHLASQGVWAKGEKARFKGEKNVQEVTVLGPSEWYSPQWLKQAGRYAEEALIAVPFAAETAPGAKFLSQYEGLDHALSAYDALLSDALYALDAASKSGSLRSTRYRGATAGLDLSKRDALSGLILMTVRKGKFVTAGSGR